jgi:hypothetical protein
MLDSNAGLVLGLSLFLCVHCFQARQAVADVFDGRIADMYRSGLLSTLRHNQGPCTQ